MEITQKGIHFRIIYASWHVSGRSHNEQIEEIISRIRSIEGPYDASLIFF